MNTLSLSVDSRTLRRELMIRNLVVSAGLGMAMLLTMSSCKSDDDQPLPELKSATYTSSSLALTYEGEAMPGKSVEVSYEKSAESGGSRMATLRMYSEFDLSQLTGTGLSGKVAGPGVLPGSPIEELEVTMIPGEGCYTFSGTASTDYVDYRYSGNLRSGLLTLNLTECALKTQTFAGMTFSPAPIEKDGLLDYTSLPFHLVWEIDPASGVDIPLSDILKGIVVAPVIPVYNNTAYTSIAEMMCSGIKTLNLTGSGNIPVVYVSTVGGAAHLATTCGNMLQYVPQAGGMKLYVNPLSALSEILVALSKPSSDAEFVTKAGESSADGSLISGLDPKVKAAFIQALAVTFAPQLSEGIPLSLTPTQNGVDIYFDTKTSVTFLSTILENMLKNPEIVQALQTYLSELKLPGMSQEEMAGILQNLPGFLEKTTRLEVGLSLVKYTPAATN